MNRFKLTVVLTSFCCIFFLACATQVSANTSVLTTSIGSTRQQLALHKLMSNPNFSIENLQVIVGDTIELYGSTETGFKRALLTKFLEHSQGVSR